MNTTQFQTVSLLDFVNYDTDRRSGDDMIHVVPRDGAIEFVRLVESVTEGADENRRITTVVDGRLSACGTRDGGRRPTAVAYHDAEAATILTWLRSLARERGNTGVAADYWERNDTPALKRAGVHTESLYLSYSVGDRTQEVVLNNAYTTPDHLRASFN